MIEALLNTAAGRTFVFAPDIGKFYAKGREVWFENTTLLHQPGDPESKHQRLMSFDDVDGNMGTKVSGEGLAQLAALVLNGARRRGERVLSRN